MEHQGARDFHQISGFICDRDGVIYHGDRVLPGVGDIMTKARAMK